MPYKDPAKQREYQRIWYTKRRTEYLADKCCAECGSTDNLEIDHEDPRKKLSHRIWSWSEKRRNEELGKCQVLCRKHHKIKTSQDNGYSLPFSHGTRSMYKRHKCRCNDCKAWNAARVAKERAAAKRRRSQAGVA